MIIVEYECGGGELSVLRESQLIGCKRAWKMPSYPPRNSCLTSLRWRTSSLHGLSRRHDRSSVSHFPFSPWLIVALMRDSGPSYRSA